MDGDVIKEIKRTNLKFDAFVENCKWAAEKNIVSSTEMIFGMPGETAKSYISGLEKLIRSGVERIYSYNLRLLSGSDLNIQAERQKYKFKSRYRLPDRDYGVYDGNNPIIESEEIPIECISYNFEDYLRVRAYGFFLEMGSGLGYFSELMKMMIRFGYSGERLLQYLLDNAVNEKNISKIFLEYIDRAKGELFDTEEELHDYGNKILLENGKLPEAKLNFIFIGKIMMNDDAKSELFNCVRDFIKKTVINSNDQLFFLDYVDNLLTKQIVKYTDAEPEIVDTKTKINVERLNQDLYDTIDDLQLDISHPCKLVLHNDAKRLLSRTDFGIDEETLYHIFYHNSNIARFGLRRLRDPSESAIHYNILRPDMVGLQPFANT